MALTQVPDQVLNRHEVNSICAEYDRLSEEERSSFFRELAKTSHTRSLEDLQKVAQDEISNIDDQSRPIVYETFLQWLRPSYENYFRNVLDHVPTGIEFLVNFRGDILTQVKNSQFEFHNDSKDILIYNSLRAISVHLVELIRPLFGESSLKLTRISLDSPAHVVDKLIQYEQVHSYSGMADVKRRLSYGRRCFGLFHPSMPLEPLVFVHVGLVEKMAPSMKYIRESSIPEHEAKAAIFYTISASQPGLAGIDLGNQLIKRVVENLRQELPQLELFSTLSPIPGFRKWLESLEQFDLGASKEFRPTLLKAIEKVNPSFHGGSELDLIRETLKIPRWYKDDSINSVLKDPLLSLGKHYISKETRPNSKGAPLCPVANFHLRNGAILARVNWHADLSPKGLLNSAGLMANYLYPLQDLHHNMLKIRQK